MSAVAVAMRDEMNNDHAPQSGETASLPAITSGSAPSAAPVAAPVTLSFADPTALGLFGLAIGCAALLPLAFGMKSAATLDALRTTAIFCLLFGGGCQFLAGLMSFANKNMLGGTLLTTFSFNWVMNWWALDGLVNGKPPSSAVVFAVDACFLVIFFAMTYAFAFYSKLLVVFLLDIDLIYGLRIARELLHTQALAMPIAIATVALMLLALYIAVALVLVNASGKSLLPIGAPLLKAAGPAPAAH
jgi:succinate-acetate transporter protein